MAEEKRMAVLIDADNVSDSYIKYIFEELSNYPYTVTYKRIYGDWTSGRLGGWKNVLLEYSITPVQQYSYTTGKNATDSAMIIDAMDILYSGDVDAFCVVSSDSDFTRLAARLRESGMYVLGMGERKTPKPFITACEAFKYLEVLCPGPVQKQPDGAADLREVTAAIKRIIEENEDESGWMYLGLAGNMLQKKMPDFDVRNYGYRKLSQLLKAAKQFKVESRPSSDGEAPLVYIANR